MLTSVRVRGTTSLTGGNDPLVLIDGVSSDLSTLSTIYPADIRKLYYPQECFRKRLSMVHEEHRVLSK